MRRTAAISGPIVRQRLPVADKFRVSGREIKQVGHRRQPHAVLLHLRRQAAQFGEQDYSFSVGSSFFDDKFGAKLFETLRDNSGVEVEFRVAANPPFMAHGHDGRYGQVFRNVIDNALSFAPKGSRILVELGRESRNGPFVVTIDDEGQGIPEDNLESIFQRFYSERPIEHFGQHSGLGLSICRQIVETYGGTITATNRRGPDGRVLGARFTVRLPAASGRK